MGGASVAVLIFAAKRGVQLEMESTHVKTTKGQESSIIVRLRSRTSRLVTLDVLSCLLGNAEIIAAELIEPEKLKLRFVGKYASRSMGLKLEVSLTDPLLIFYRTAEIGYVDFTLDIIPDSLLAPPSARRLPIMALGELPAGSPGSGQELYGMDVYHPFTETKDIIWRRVAKSPDSTLVARIRESNVKDTVKIGIVQVVDRGQGRAVWMDRVCEGLGFLGKEILQIGAEMLLIFPSGTDVAVERVVTPMELVEAIMSYSLVPPSDQRVVETITSCDLVITGFRELEDLQIADSLSTRTALLISEVEGSPRRFGGRSVLYTGKENLMPLVRMVMER